MGQGRLKSDFFLALLLEGISTNCLNIVHLHFRRPIEFVGFDLGLAIVD